MDAPGETKKITRRFNPGAYRVVITPPDVEARFVARLKPIVAPLALVGHGPHALPFDTAQRLQWREPQAKDSPRAPDVWRFTLRGDSDVSVAIGEGMIGEIVKGANEAMGKVTSDHVFKAKLTNGDYRVEARSLAHDDRLDYEISLSSKQLQPGAKKRVDLPARLEFSLAKESLVDLSGFGATETIGVLKDASSIVVERLPTRADDWNVALSRRLPAGEYRLELEELGAKPKPLSEDSIERSDEDDSGEEITASNEPEENESGVEIRLAILDEEDGGALAPSGKTTVAGAGAHRLTLPPTPSGSLAVVVARSENEVALSIERHEADGRWSVAGVVRGVHPVAAWPAGDDKSDWRAIVWSVGGSSAPITLAAHSVNIRARTTGDISFEAVDGVDPQLCVAKVATRDSALVELTARADIFAGSKASQMLRPARSGPIAPQAQALWLAARGDCNEKVRVDDFEWKGEEFSLDIEEGDRAHLPPLATPTGKSRLWLARSAFAQPGVDAGRGMGVAQGAALALAGDTAPQVWNAKGGGVMRVALRAIDVETREPVSVGAKFSGLIAPMSAQPIEIEKSDSPLAFDLAAGVAAFMDSRAIFGDGAATTRVVHGAGERVLLVNLTESPQPARIARTMEPSILFDAKTILRRFFATSGQISLPLASQRDDRLIVIGADATVVTPGGKVDRGRDISLNGASEAIVEFKPGLVAAWIERGQNSPWPQAPARLVTPPQRMKLEGASMRVAVKQDRPALLTARSDAPAIVGFTQSGKREIASFAVGVNLQRYISTGEAALDIYAPHEGTLSGTLDVSVQPTIDAHEGVNDAVAVSPGSTTVFTFETKRDAEIGYGMRSEPDRVIARLFDASGKTLAEGVTQTVRVAPGRYFLEARAPSDSGATTIRVAIVGVSPPPASPPAEVVAELLEKAGLRKSKVK